MAAEKIGGGEVANTGESGKNPDDGRTKFPQKSRFGRFGDQNDGTTGQPNRPGTGESGR